jgi:DNA-binding NtrC family response regulator
VPQGNRILVVDDDETVRGFLRDLLSANGHAVETAGDVRGAAELLKSGDFELVLTDLMLPDGDGQEVLRIARARPSEPEVLIITAYGTIDSAVEAVKAGAFDYLTKPIPSQRILVTVGRAIERRSLRSEVSNLRREVSGRYAVEGFVAASAGMRRVLEIVQIVSVTDSPILIQGESGTGKELVARAIHFRGARSGRPFVALNCAALPEALLESELFGYVKGAFTGAASDRKGLFEGADGGTLLLDEIGDMPIALQGKLLRVLQEGEIRRVGSTAVRRVDVRILASTNRELPELIREGKFREDLFYRLNVIPLIVPPLRERPDDIVPLCRHFLEMHGKKQGREALVLDPDALEVALAHSWPGNVRELENVIERVVTLCPSPVVSGDEFRRILDLGRQPGQRATPAGRPGATVESAEREAIIRALQAAAGNQTKAAEALGIARNTLWRKLKKLGIGQDPPEEPPVP